MNPMKKKLPRPRIQRAFVRWFRENHTRFAVPVRLSKITAIGILLTFPQHPDCLSAWLSRWSLSASVDWRGMCWDLLISLDSCPEPVPGGYRCRLNMKFVESWPTREAVWRNNLFEPFLWWVNNMLAHSRKVTLYGRPGESTWASLGLENDSSSESISPWRNISFS